MPSSRSNSELGQWKTSLDKASVLSFSRKGNVHSLSHIRTTRTQTHLQNTKAMSLGNWDDEDFELAAPAAAGPSSFVEDDLFEFTETLRLSDDETNGVDEENELPPLPVGTRDVIGDRGVLLALTKEAGSGDKPSKEEPFVEIHYEGFLVSSGERFDSSRDQNYAMIVQLDIPPSGKSSLIRGLEVGLRELRSGDVATLTVAPRYAYGKDGAPDIPPDAALRFEVEVLDVRATHKRIVTVDSSEQDLTRLEDVKRQREIAQQRREEEQSLKDEEKQRKAERAAALREKIANKNKGGKKGGKKKGKK